MVAIRLRNRVEELAPLQRAVDAFAQDHDLGERDGRALQLVLEEIVTNLIRHGYDDDDPHEILVRLELEEDQLTIQIEDDGRSFDPKSARSPDTDAPILDRPIGGLGLHLVRSLVDELDHRRRAGRNILTPRKRGVRSAGSGP